MVNKKLKSVKMGIILGSRFYFILFGLFFYGCSGSDATILSYINPSLNSSSITCVSVFPLRNTFNEQNSSLVTGDMIQLNKTFQVEFANKNSKTKILDPISSTELLSKFNLVNSYDTLLSDYNNTSIPNAQILNKIGQDLKIDPIIQGFVLEVFQVDGYLGSFNVHGKRSNQGETKVTIKYVMFSTRSGDVLWEATGTGYKSVSSLLKAPPISDMIELIKEKLISAMPTLSIK